MEPQTTSTKGPQTFSARKGKSKLSARFSRPNFSKRAPQGALIRTTIVDGHASLQQVASIDDDFDDDDDSSSLDSPEEESSPIEDVQSDKKTRHRRKLHIPRPSLPKGGAKVDLMSKMAPIMRRVRSADAASTTSTATSSPATSSNLPRHPLLDSDDEEGYDDECGCIENENKAKLSRTREEDDDDHIFSDPELDSDRSSILFRSKRHSRAPKQTDIPLMALSLSG